MTELEHYQPTNGHAPARITGGTVVAHDPAANPLDGWIQVMADVAKLAEYIAGTEMVPEAVRGRPAAVAAIILTGREMNLPPLMSLRHIHIVKGKPGMSAEIMRAQVLAAGHEIEFVETTDTRCVVRGRRKGESSWLTVSFTADQARRAKIDLGGYPEDKLVARATSRLCRRRFPDCVAGVPTVDELEDDRAPLDTVGQPAAIGGVVEGETDAQPERTAQRRTATRRTRKATPADRAAARTAETPAGEEQRPAAETNADAGPPLPGEEGYDDAETPDRSRAESPPASDAQVRLMHRLFKEAEVEDRGERLKLTGLLLERQLDTSKGLTVADASAIIDALSALKASGHEQGLPGAVNDMLNLAALREAEAESTSDAEDQADEQPADAEAGDQ